MADTTSVAVAAAERGWAVFPVLPNDKRPAINGWPTRALTDPRAVARSWPSGHNVGIACGLSRLVVVDLDMAKRPMPGPWQECADGSDVFGALLAGHDSSWPATYQVGTPSGGMHLYFAADVETVRNSASKLGPCIDIRADGGYVLGAGSVIDDRSYQPLYGSDDLTPAPLPAWIHEALKDKPAPVLAVAPTLPVRHADRYTAAAVRGELFAVATAANGTRNDQLNRSAYALARFVSAGQLDPHGVADALVSAACTAGLSEREAQRTVASAFTARCA
jgi:hypothetical protein